MQHSPTRDSRRALLALAICSSALSASCAFDEGRAWGEVELALSVQPGDGLVAALEGPVELASGSRLALDTLTVAVEHVELSEHDEAGSSDADCHDAHCHGESPPAADGLQWEVSDAPLAIAGSTTTLDLGRCTNDCLLMAPTELEAVHVAIHELSAAGSVTLPDGTQRPFELEWEVESEVSGSMDEAVGEGQPSGISITAVLHLPDELLELFEAEPSATNLEVRGALEGSDSLDVSVTRFEVE